MNKTITYIFIFTLLLSSFSTFAQKKVISESDLPFTIREYIATHFKENKIIKCEGEKKGNLLTYEIKLDHDIQLEFNSINNLKEIKAKLKLPDSVIPPSILSYLKMNYPDKVILEWELESKNQEVKLDNGLKLVFTRNGKYLRMVK